VIPSDFGTQYSFHKPTLTGLLGSEKKLTTRLTNLTQYRA